ncbi:MAG: glycosyltransferase [Actinomycetota bacterium]|nr:glycosyltransferase [Actinomycetota bacterium]
MSRRPTYGVVVLSQGQRPADLDRGLTSLLAQTGVDLDVVVVGNGWDPVGLPAGARGVALSENVGIPAGRNAGVPYVSGELLFFLDDDARLRDTDTLARLGRLFADEPEVGLVQPRVLDPDGRPAPRRWTPRLRVGDPARSSDVTAVWEGAVAIRRELFERIGGWAGEFFYAHEGIDLAWAVWDAEARVRYAGDLVALHPAVAPTRHADLYRRSVRNRVFLARRRLPRPVAAVYLLVWSVLTLSRLRGRQALADSVRGVYEGLHEDAGFRRPIAWRTVWRMTRAGRPPIV